MERVEITIEQRDMIDRRIAAHLFWLRRPEDIHNCLRDIYFQGFIDCMTVLLEKREE